jgi:predicted GNAT family acetyltransferase
MEVIDNPQQHRFELALDDGAIAVACYDRNEDRIVLTHTEVPAGYAGRGVGARLATGVFEAIRGSGRKATLECSFMRRFYAAHPEYADIVEG